jgi:hypothetical protein
MDGFEAMGQLDGLDATAEQPYLGMGRQVEQLEDGDGREPIAGTPRRDLLRGVHRLDHLRVGGGDQRARCLGHVATDVGAPPPEG